MGTYRNDDYNTTFNMKDKLVVKIIKVTKVCFVQSDQWHIFQILTGSDKTNWPVQHYIVINPKPKPFLPNPSPALYKVPKFYNQTKIIYKHIYKFLRMKFSISEWCIITSRDLDFKLQLNVPNSLDVWILQLPILNCVSLIIWFTITSHFLINIFQMVHLSAIKFMHVHEKIWTSILTPKSLKVWKNLNKIRLGSFNIH